MPRGRVYSREEIEIAIKEFKAYQKRKSKNIKVSTSLANKILPILKPYLPNPEKIEDIKLKLSATIIDILEGREP